MCTYITEQRHASGSAKGAQGWFPVSSLTVYYDHPVHAQVDHSLNIDFANPARGAASRAAVELSTATAVDLVEAVATVLGQVPTELSGLDVDQSARLARAADLLAGAGVGSDGGPGDQPGDQPGDRPDDRPGGRVRDGAALPL